MKRRVTQKDIAIKAGVHRGTVSLAMKSHPSIPIATRERILRIADQLGYRPDPMLSSLAAYRNITAKHPFRGTMAWLAVNYSRPSNDWKKGNAYRQYYEGACFKADQYGYKIDTFEFRPDKMSPERLAAIFRARNIRGILLCPQEFPETELNLPWENLAFITFGYTLQKPALHSVTATHYRSTINVLRKMYEYGYRRIAYAFNKEHNERVDGNFLAGYLTYCKEADLQPIFYDYHCGQLKDFKKFMCKQRLDGVITGDTQFAEHARKIGIKIPDDIVLAAPTLHRQDSEISGIYEDSFHIGEVAVEHLNTFISNGQFGIPEKAQRTLIEGIWVEGKTLRRPHRRDSF